MEANLRGRVPIYSPEYIFFGVRLFLYRQKDQPVTGGERERDKTCEKKVKLKV